MTQPDSLAIITALQRELTELRKRIESMPTAPSRSLGAGILAVVAKAPGPVTYADLAKATGLTKSVLNTELRKLAFARKIWLSLEPGPGRRLTYAIRRPEDVVVASQLPTSAPS